MGTNFSYKWDTEVRQLAKKCINIEFMELFHKAERETMESEEEQRFKEIAETLKDPYGMWYISQMIWQVEHGLADDRDYQSKLAIAQVHACLSSDSYLQNVWNNDTSSEECQNMMKLKEGLGKLLKL